MCQGFNHFSGFLHHFVLAKLATSSIRVKVLSQLSNGKMVLFQLIRLVPIATMCFDDFQVFHEKVS